MKIITSLNPFIYDKFQGLDRLIIGGNLIPPEREVMRYQFRVFINARLTGMNQASPEYESFQRLLGELQHDDPLVDQALEELLGLFPNTEAVHLAAAVAVLAHEEQHYLAGLRICPYSFHPIDVALILVNELNIYDEIVICTALLHDVAERTDRYSLKDIWTQFGPNVAEAVALLTMREERNYRWRWEQIWENETNTRFVALACRLHHLRNLRYFTRPLQKYLAHTRDFFLPIMEDTKNPAGVYLMRQIKKALITFELDDAVKERVRNRFLSLIQEQDLTAAMELMKTCGEFVPLYQNTSAGSVEYRIKRDRLFMYLVSSNSAGKEINLYRGN